MLIVGLGNIGKEYSQTRHNIGRWAVSQYCLDNDIDLSIKPKLKASVGSLNKNIFVIPMLYMNESGLAVSLCSKWFDKDVEECVIVHDDFDLPVGDIRVKKGGGNAGHNGIKSIEQHLKSKDFYRIRIGIGRPPTSDLGANYALKHLGNSSWEELCSQSSEALEEIKKLSES